MTDTIVDLPKVAQTLDAGWVVQIRKGGCMNKRFYTVSAAHENREVFERLRPKLAASYIAGGCSEADAELCAAAEMDGGTIETDDATPEQALTRMAYKVLGEII